MKTGTLFLPFALSPLLAIIPQEDPLLCKHPMYCQRVSRVFHLSTLQLMLKGADTEPSSALPDEHWHERCTEHICKKSWSFVLSSRFHFFLQVCLLHPKHD